MNKIIISPLSDSNNVKLIKTFEVVDVIKRWINEFGIDITDEFVNIGKYIYLYRCNDSGLLFFEPKIEGSAKIYKELQNTFDWYYLDDKWEYDIAKNEIKKFDNIIEIGCGKGTFIKKVLKDSSINIVGLETSSEAVNDARSNNLPVYLNHIGEYVKENPNSKIDVIIAFQVLEHLTNPLEFLKTHIKHLAKGGKLIICVPNLDCFYKYSDELLDMPPHHATKWSVQSFRYLEKVLPIKLKKVSYEPLYYMHIGIWLRNYSTHFRKSKWYGRYLFNKITIPIWKKILNSNLKRLIKGHTLYISFEKK